MFAVLGLPVIYLFAASFFPSESCASRYGTNCGLHHRVALPVTLTALALLALLAGALHRTTGRPPPSRHPPLGLERFVYYGVALLFGIPIAFGMGGSNFSRLYCSASDFDGECDLGILEGMAWSVMWLAFVAAAVIALEVHRFANRTTRSTTAEDPTPSTG